VSAAMYLGSHWEVRLFAAGHEVLIELPAGQSPPAAGGRVRMNIGAAHLHVYPAGRI
jgi:hypothetical protein